MNRLSELSRSKRYALAIAIIFLSTLARAALTPLVGAKMPFVTYVPAVAAAAWLGFGPGFLALGCSLLLADWLFLEPINASALLAGNLETIPTDVGFLFVGGILVLMTGGFSRAQARALAEAREGARRGELLRVTLQSIGDGVVTTDPAGRVTLLNPVAETLTGWTSADAAGRPLAEVFNIINERTRRRVENPCDKVLKTGKVVGLANHTVLIDRNGVERPIDDSAAPILNDRDEIIGVVLVFHDATQSRETFAVLQTVAAIVEHSDDAVIGKDNDGVITSWNAAAERLYHYTATEAIGKHISLIVPEEHRSEVEQVMQRMRRGERIEHWDTVRRRKDGTLVDVSLRISPIKNAYGEVVGFSKVAREITERKRAEAALQFVAATSASLAALVDKESALQQSAQSMTPFFADFCVIHTLSADGRIEQQACASSRSEHARQLEQFLEKYPVDWSMRTGPVEAMKTGRTVFMPTVADEVFQEAARNDDHLDAMRKMGLKSVICVPLKVRAKILGAISFAMASSGRRYEPQDVAVAEDLARRVAVAIDNAELLASVKAADRQKDEFLAMLAHELRNPLAAISYAVAAARLNDGEPNANMMDLIDRQVTNLARLIDDLLDMSRISRDKIQLRRETIDLATLVRRAADAVRAMMEEKRHQLVVELPNEAMPIHVDPTRAEQIIVNLLANAAKYTTEGGRIELRAHCENGEGVIKVRDNGIGISREMLPYVFELFAQADRSLDRSQGGLGIGLTVVRKLTELHGGSVSAHSAGVGQGSEFTVRLPMCGVEAVARTNGEAPKAASTSRKLRILVIEDNLDTAKVQELLLKKHGHEVTVAHDGPAGLEAAQAFRPQAVLVDIGLPLLNGYEVASRLREQGFSRELLVAVSGYGQLEDRERSRAAGFDHHLVKPVNHEDLLALLNDVEPQNGAST
jgi:PAS domain S-box-containing protein